MNKSIIMKVAYSNYNKNIVNINESVIEALDLTNQQLNNLELSENENEALKGMTINESIKFLIGLNSINFRYWDLNNGNFNRYQHNGQIGALAAYEGFIDLWKMHTTHSDFYDKLSINTIETYFGDIPDKQNRLIILKESLNPILSNEVAYQIEKKITSGEINTTLAHDISQLMPKSFKEPYLKKIQLALYEMSLYARTKGYNIKDSLTVAADYQLPKVLEAMGILEYSQELKHKIDNHIELPENSKEEIAIRAATIIACEYLASKHNLPITSIDRWLWLARNDFKDKKFHLTKTTAY